MAQRCNKVPMFIPITDQPKMYIESQRVVVQCDPMRSINMADPMYGVIPTITPQYGVVPMAIPMYCQMQQLSYQPANQIVPSSYSTYGSMPNIISSNNVPSNNGAMTVNINVSLGMNRM